MKNRNKLTAFTLAEVLITIGIIGVVAASTIPTLISNYQKQEYVSKFKKTYTVLNQAFMQYAVDQGCPGNLECTGLFSDTTTNKANEWQSFFNNYLKIANDCGTGDGCFTTYENCLNISPCTVATDSDGGYYKVMLMDGQSIGIQTFTDAGLNCHVYYNYDVAGSLKNTCAFIIIDTNGLNGPNKVGRDYFAENSLYLTSEHFVVPAFGSRDWVNVTYNPSFAWSDTTLPAFYCGTEADSVGYGCASRIIEEGWEMKY